MMIKEYLSKIWQAMARSPTRAIEVAIAITFLLSVTSGWNAWIAYRDSNQIIAQDLWTGLVTLFSLIILVPLWIIILQIVKKNLHDHKVSQKNLQCSEERARATLLALPDLVFRVNSDGQYLDFLTSPQGQNLVDPQQVIGKSMYEVLPANIMPDHARNKYTALQQALATQTVQIYEQQVWLEGKIRHEEVRVAPCNNDEVVFFVRNISDHKEAEIALQESQHFIRQIADSSPNILYLYDLQEQKNVYVNCEIGAILGYTPTEIQAMGSSLFQNLTHPDDFSRLLAQYDLISAAQDGEILELEYRMRHANGEWHWLYSRDTIFSRDTEGRVKQTISTAQDITERKRLEQSQNRLISILEASTDYILIAEVTGTAIWNNVALKQIRGLDNDAVTRQRPIDYHPQWVVDVLEQQAVPIAIANGSWLGETALLDAEGQEIPVSQLLLAHKSPQGEMEFFSTIMRDMRVYKEYERQLEQKNAELVRATRLKDEFLANMSHELRTPLNAILGMAEGIQDGTFGAVNEKQIKALQTLERSGLHLLELINDILDAAKIESGQMRLNLSPTAVAPLCQSSLAFIKQQALKKHIQIEVKSPQNLPELLVDERRIRQVLINLLNNAVKFTPEGKRIILEITSISPTPATTNSTAPDHLRIAVIDTGIGIAPEDAKNLFQPFIQIDSALNRQHTGTGLGLVLVKRIVELHGGRVELTSKLGAGSCFAIELPCIPNFSRTPKVVVGDRPILTPELNSPNANPNLDQAPLILLTEDNAANIDTVSSYLKAKGYRILSATNGQEAIDLATIHHPDLILMDIQMPVMDGIETIEKMRLDLNLADIPIIVLTALAMNGDRDLCLKAGANDYFAKPFKLKELTSNIQQLLGTQKNHK